MVKLLPLQSFSRSHTAEWCAQTACQECCAICTVHPAYHQTCTWASSAPVASNWVSSAACLLQPVDLPRSGQRPPADCRAECLAAHPCACHYSVGCCCCCCGCSLSFPSD